jgi:uncharacterized membrane protein YhiD involved in acid resistance
MSNNYTTFQDIFKNSVLKVFETTQIDTTAMVLSLLTALVCGILIYIFYRFFYKGVVYSHNYNVMLIVTTLVTSFIILTISTNIVLSLGMVGALSIVRFRAAIKDPLDVGFLFWAVAAGIASGAGLYFYAILATAGIGIVYMIASRISPRKRVYLLVVRYQNKANEEVMRILSAMKTVLKNKTGINDTTEMTLEIKLKNNNTLFVTKLSAIDGVESCILVEYSGDYAQ